MGDLKYGHRHGGKMAVPVAIAASQTIVAASGKFVYMNDGAATLCADASQRIFGHLEAGAGSPSTGDIFNCIIDLTAVYRIPVNSGTYAVDMIGDTCDISISASNVQGAQLDASEENTLIVVGGDADNNAYVDVMISPGVWGTGAGADGA
jgi:hypothetical protein